MKLSIKFIVILEILVLVSISIIGFMSYRVGSESIKERIEAQLESVLILKTIHLDNFFRERKEDVQSSSNYFSEQFATEEKYEPAVVREKLTEKLNENSFFSEFFVIGLDGKISISTDENQEGKSKSTERYFIDGKDNMTIQSFYYDASLQQPAVTISSPVRDNGSTISVFAGRVDLAEISFILTERSGLGETGETYLVNNFNYAVTQLRNEETPSFKKAIYSDLVEHCLKEKSSGTKFMTDYVNYAGEEVVGGITYLPELNACLVAEINEDEAFAPLVNLGNNLFSFVSVIAISIIVLGYFVSKTVTNPIKRLSDVTKKISKGDLNAAIDINSKDEIGSLAESFDTMRESLKKARQSLLDSQKVLEEKVEERTKELDEKVVKLNESEIATLNIMEDLQRTVDALEMSKSKIEVQNVKLKKLDKIKSDFLNVTSHELRTPMSAIKGYTQMVLKQTLGNVTQEQKQALNVVLRNTNRLDNLIQDILDISRLESGTMKFIPEPADIRKMVDEAVETMQPNADIKNIKITGDVEGNLPEIIIDPERVKQVIVNIVNNAIKFSPEGSVVNVRAKRQEDDLLFEIQDNGRGIPKEKQKKIFDTFYQVDGGMDRKFGGAGLGLAICRGIVLSHGGEIWVESAGKIGEGSTFKFTLPFKPVQDLEGKFREIDIFGLEESRDEKEKDLRKKMHV